MTSPAPGFVSGRPFYNMVASFLAATVGMGPVFNPNNPLKLGPEVNAWYRGRLNDDLIIDMGQVQQCLSNISADLAVTQLCRMLLISTYEIAEHHNDKSPEFEVFRHLRNAAAHGNRFTFR